MNLRPVIERELRTAARQLTTYYSRLVPGILLLSFAAFIYLESRMNSTASQVGSIMFSVLNATLFSLIWLIVPLTTADLISREKREDTLGLLLLTPLRPFEIVISKMLGGLFRGSTLILAVIPIIAVPMLLGGITPMDLVRIAFLNLSALVGATAAGVVASSFCERRGRAWFVSFVVAVLSFSVLYSLHVFLLVSGLLGTPISSGYIFGNMMNELWSLPIIGWLSSSGILDFWRAAGSSSNAANVGIAGCVLVLSILFSGLGVFYAARRVRRFADERNLSERQQKIRSALTRELFFARTLRTQRNRLLERNPSAWMVGRKWTARLAKWGWLFLSVSVLTMATFDMNYYFGSTILLTSMWLGVFMLVSVLLISATSLQHERDSGALELLLVTHLGPPSFVAGRLSGIRRSFLPGAIAIVLVFGYIATLSMGQYVWRTSYQDVRTLISFGSLAMFFLMLLYWLPVIGVCFSLNRPGILSSCLNTFFFGVVVPWLLPMAVFGTGMFIYGGVHDKFGNGFPYRNFLLSFIGVLAVLQIGVWFAIKSGKLNDFPVIWPHWFSRWKMFWLAPWILPVAAWLGVESLDEWFPHSRHEDVIMLITWQAVAWLLLIYIAIKCRRALIEMLEKRTFLNT